MLIVAPGAIEAPLVAQRLERWGAQDMPRDGRSKRARDAAPNGIGTRSWSIARSAREPRARWRARPTSPRRIVLLTPAERHELARSASRRLYRLSGEAGARGLARGPLRRGDRRSPTWRMPADARGAPERAGAGLAVLVAEDNDINALLARALLHRLGHRPTVAPNGAAAVDAFAAAAAPARLTISC